MIATTKIMRDFLGFRGGFLERQRIAVQQIGYIMSFNKKKELLSKVTQELAKIEYSVRELQPWARDHVVHALLSFILGIFLEFKLLRPALDNPFDPLQWKLVGLFHDVGYPAQIAREALIGRFVSAINKTRDNIGVSRPDVYPRIELMNIDRLQGTKTSFELIQERINKWNLKIDAKQEYLDTVSKGDVRHGMASSLSLLYLLDALYEKHNPDRLRGPIYTDGVDFDQRYFERDIVSACSAIYIHDLPSNCFEEARIDRSKAPVAFLLRLSDTKPYRSGKDHLLKILLVFRLNCLV